MSAIDIYLGSKELKRTIVERSFNLELPLRYICKEIGVDYKTFMSSYVNSLESTSFPITEDQFERMLEILGIGVRYQFIIDSDFDSEKMRFYLKSKHDKQKIIKIDEEEGSSNTFGVGDH